MAEWGKVYGSLHGSAKWRRATKGARALWTTALSWCVDQEASDGEVPRDMLKMLDGTAREASNLVEVELWDVTPGGWRFHDWSQRQRTRDQIQRDRESAAQRQRRARERRTAHAVPPTAPAAVSHAVSHASRVEQSRVEERTTVSSSPAAPATVRVPPGAFDKFWATYPRKVGKDAARRAFDKAARRVGHDTITAGAHRFAADPNLPAKEFIPHPATWLNAGRWDDEPLPPRTDPRTGAPATAPTTSPWDRYAPRRGGGDGQ